VRPLRDRGRRALESRLVWIFGSPRSGSTWLLDLLVHPLIPDDANPLGVVRRAAPEAGRARAVPINEPYIPQHLAPPLFSDRPAEDGLAIVSLNSFRHSSPSYFFSDRYAEAWRPALRRLVLARLGAQADELSAAYGLRSPLLVIKEPNGSGGADEVLALFPDSRMIFLLRDGRDIVDSMVDAQAAGGWLERSTGTELSTATEQRLELVAHESRLWVARTKAVKRAFDAHPAQRRLLLRYEDVRREPAARLAELDDWLSLGRAPSEREDALRWNDFDSYPAEAKGRGMPLRAAQPGLWRQNLSPAEQQAMTEIMGPTLAAFGYEN
jgi:Sulfotransferase family